MKLTISLVHMHCNALFTSCSELLHARQLSKNVLSENELQAGIVGIFFILKACVTTNNRIDNYFLKLYNATHKITRSVLSLNIIMIRKSKVTSQD